MKQEQQDALRAPFPKEQIQKLPTGGLQLDYVSHAWVTDRLLKVDPTWNCISELIEGSIPSSRRIGCTSMGVG